MGKRLLAGVLALCLLLGGCSTDRGSSGSLENDPPKQEEVSREEPKFVKVKYAYFDDREDPQRYYVGFYALDSAGELFLYDRNQDTLKSIATGIQDFTSGKNSCYYAVGLTETGDYWTNYPNDTWPPFDREIDQVFPGVVLYTDGSLAVCSGEWRLYKPEEWNPQNIAIQEIRFVIGWGAALDQDGTLWYLSWNFGREPIFSWIQVAEEVQQFDFSLGDKLWYTNDVSYRKADDTLAFTPYVSGNPYGPAEALDLPPGTLWFQYQSRNLLTQNPDRTYRYMPPENCEVWNEELQEYQYDPSLEGLAFEIPIKGVQADLAWSFVVILDEEGKVHFIEMENRKGIVDEVVISHP